jgi:hypothetical protein
MNTHPNPAEAQEPLRSDRALHLPVREAGSLPVCGLLARSARFSGRMSGRRHSAVRSA